MFEDTFLRDAAQMKIMEMPQSQLVLRGRVDVQDQGVIMHIFTLISEDGNQSISIEETKKLLRHERNANDKNSTS